MKIIKYFMLLLSLSTCRANEWFAKDVERSTFENYVNNIASPSDTIYFPPDTAVWHFPFTIKKGVTIIGAGMNSTCIMSNYSSSDPLLIYDPAVYELNTPFRLSGFTIDLRGKSRGIYLGHENISQPYKIQTQIRIDHIRFKGPKPGASAQYIWNFNTYGVVDNNIFEPCNYPIKADPSADCTWWEYETYTPGAKDDCMYFEDNIFQGISGTLTDCQFCGRYCYRYNRITITNDIYPLFDLHGNQPETYGMCSAFGGEIYGNLIIGNFKLRLLDQRGGQCFAYFNNKISNDDYYEIQVREEYPDAGNPPERAPDGQPQYVSDSYYWNNRMNTYGKLNSVVETDHVNDIPLENRDYFQDARVDNGFFNGTQNVGCGPLSSRPAQCSTGVGYWATEQSVTDLTGKVGAQPDSIISGVFYKAIATNTWIEFYRPLPYPHPLRKLEPPHNFRFMKYQPFRILRDEMK